MSRNLILREKDRVVLNVIVESYLKSGQPVSSGAVVEKRALFEADVPVQDHFDVFRFSAYVFAIGCHTAPQ